MDQYIEYDLQKNNRFFGIGQRSQVGCRTVKADAVAERLRRIISSFRQMKFQVRSVGSNPTGVTFSHHPNPIPNKTISPTSPTSPTSHSKTTNPLLFESESIAEANKFLFCNIQGIYMQLLKKQNEDLRKTVEAILEEIQKQKELNLQHEQQIETLLKFNQRLLGIIENQVNSNKRDNCSLKPISERSERQSDLVVPTLHSLIKVRKFGGPAGATKSQRGYDATDSLVAHNAKPNPRLFEIEAAKSEINISYSAENSETQKANPIFQKATLADSVEVSDHIKSEIQNEIKQIKKLKDEGTKFYDDKISQIRTLSSKLNNCSPLQQLNRISQKLTLSTATSNLLKKVITKSNQ